ncbi:uncharacterized protein LOC113272560 [Papaver somniferum]|uniref:uncharacterized protein LOC113272560 n=1 Tax=Papaver somniferum TaxID=3469 RepID=UPI000E6F8A4A|nr:uncharacterized protein LOC113272560 [Papaver somniferum]
MITVSIADVLVSGVHAHVKVVQMRFLWSEMQLISDLNKPWIILGDFNAVISQEKKVGGRLPNMTAMLDFSECINQCELLPAPKNGLQFSWSNCQQGSKRILSFQIQKIHLGNFRRCGLAIPILCKYFLSVGKKRITGDPAFKFLHKLKELKKELNEWNWKVFGNVQVNIKEPEERVKEATVISDNNPFDEDVLNELVQAQNEHANRTARNTIAEIEDNDGNVLANQELIVQYLVNHFLKKFEYTLVEVADELLEVIPKVINKDDERMLNVLPEEEDIKKIIFEMDPESAPGPDGFSCIFYRSCWDIIKQDLVAVIQFCWRRKFIPKGMNSSFLFLLPKTQVAKTVNQFIPIGLSTVIFKIFTKIITSRMSELMKKLISPKQVAYVKGRIIHEQILLASELVNEMKFKRRGGNVSIKLDISQAYDTVSWEFLIKVLKQYGFSNDWCEWTITLFKSARMSVLVNGGPCGFFKFERGLR